MKRPIQPLFVDTHGVLRFKKNAIVEYLLDNGNDDMNSLAGKDFSQEDREQFAQLIGYSLSGFAELNYVSDETYLAAVDQYENKTWKSATENLPLISGTWCWVYRGTDVCIAKRSTVFGDDWINGDWEEDENLEITHWQEIEVPDAPQS